MNELVKQTVDTKNKGRQRSTGGNGQERGLLVGCLVAYRPSNVLVYLRDGSA